MNHNFNSTAERIDWSNKLLSKAVTKGISKTANELGMSENELRGYMFLPYNDMSEETYLELTKFMNGQH